MSIDLKYINLVSSQLEKFQQRNPDLFNFRCPYCNDSKKSLSKTRGYIYYRDSCYLFICHNCDKRTTLKNFLYDMDQNLGRNYSLETFNNDSFRRNFETKEQQSTKIEINLPTIFFLPNSHQAKKYVISRKIPNQYHKELFYAENFKEFVENISETRFKDSSLATPRLIIPFFDKDKNLIAFQGRAFDNTSIRYITIKLQDSLKLYGLHRLQEGIVRVLEGPIDSLMLKNAIATADSNLAVSSKVIDKARLVLIPDKDIRNKEIIKKVDSFVEDGYTVCLLPNDFPGKDINEAIINGISTIEDIVDKYTFSGLKLKLEFSKWKKC